MAETDKMAGLANQSAVVLLPYSMGAQRFLLQTHTELKLIANRHVHLQPSTTSTRTAFSGRVVESPDSYYPAYHPSQYLAVSNPVNEIYENDAGHRILLPTMKDGHLSHLMFKNVMEAYERMNSEIPLTKELGWCRMGITLSRRQIRLLR